MNLFDLLSPADTGLQQLRNVVAQGGHFPVQTASPFSLISAEKGAVTLEAVVDRSGQGFFDILNSGHAAALLDWACACALHSRLETRQGFAMVERKLSYHNEMPRVTSKLWVKGRVIALGGRAAFVETSVKGGNEELYVSANSTLSVFDLGVG